MILLNSNQTIYIAIACLGLALIIFLIVVLIRRNVYQPKHIREMTYLKLRRFCEANDYLLLNNFRVDIDDKNIGIIDHIVISNKFIIIINDFALSGVLSGDYSDQKLKLYTKKKTDIIVNPLNYNINLTKRLALYNDLSAGLIRGLVVINNDSNINVTNCNGQFRIIQLKELRKTIREFDKEPVKRLKEENVVNFIQYLDGKNEKK